MTCSEAMALIDPPEMFFRGTRAERVAFARHCGECSPCRQYIRDKSQQERDKSPAPEELCEAEFVGGMLALSDLQDPEAEPR
jgi:hypothetical protein